MTDVRIVPLEESHDVSNFQSGEESLDRWLKQHAFANQVAHSSRTFVLLDSESPQVWGYYSLTVATIQRAEVTKAGRSGMPPAYDIPAVLLARMARDEKRRAEGYGALMLADAVLRTQRMADEAGIRLLAAHALNEMARQWYLAHDFQQSPIDDRLLMLTVPDLLATWDSQDDRKPHQPVAEKGLVVLEEDLDGRHHRTDARHHRERPPELSVPDVAQHILGIGLAEPASRHGRNCDAINA